MAQTVYNLFCFFFRYYQLHEAREAALPVSRLISRTMAGPSCQTLPSGEEPPAVRVTEVASCSALPSAEEPPAGRAMEVAPCSSQQSGEEPIVQEPVSDEDVEIVPPTPAKQRRISQVGIVRTFSTSNNLYSDIYKF